MPANPSSAAHLDKPKKKPAAGDYIAKIIVFLMMASLAVALNTVAYNDFVSIKDDLWLNSHGVLARNPYLHVFHGHRTASELCAYYDTQQGKAYHKCVELWFPLVFIDEHSPEVIHYDPASPEHISTSWGRQILFSRTFSLIVALVFAFMFDFGGLMSVVELIARITGKESPPVPPAPNKPLPGLSESNRLAASAASAAKASSSLQASALKLSHTLNDIVTGLQSNTGPNAAYAQASAAELAPLVAQYDHAVLVAHSREQANDALNSIVESMSYFIAGTRKRKMSFGLRHALAMRTYDDLHDIFRASKYRDASLE